MKYRIIPPILGFLICASAGFPAFGNGSAEIERLEAVFDAPPRAALPRGYWVWSHGNFDYTTISRELESFKKMGLGGVDIFDLGVRDPFDVIPSGPAFMSPEQVDGMAFALEEGKRLGLDMGLIVSSSWNAGGPWIDPAHGTMTLIAREVEVDQKEAGEITLEFPEVPETFEKPYGTFRLNVPLDEGGLPEFRREIALLAYPRAEEGEALDPGKALLLDGILEEDGRVRFHLPKGKWWVQRFVQTSFGQSLFIPSDNSKGWIADHFSAEATRLHFGEIIDRLKARVGDLSETSLERFYLASFEAVALMKWTTGYRDAFMNLHGYDPLPWLPVLTGATVGDAAKSERFEHDYLKTISELFINNHYRLARELSNREGVLIASEAGGPGPPLHDVPTEDLKALGSLDIMRGEFWNRPFEEQRKDSKGLPILQVVKNIASAAHIYGHKVVEMEAFTSHRLHWEEDPMVLKPLADRAFCEGMTRVVYHTMHHNPPEAGVPGWSFQAGTHIGPGQAWWEMSRPFHAYLARVSALLQEGTFVADAAYYSGGNIPNFAHPKHVRPDLGYGYDYDDLNTEVLTQPETRVDANGRIVLKSGMRYAVLVLPEDDRMDLEALRKIAALVREGATVIGPKPRRIYGLAGYPEDERALRALADQVWGDVDGRTVKSGAYGEGRIHWGRTAREVLMEMGIGPDVSLAKASASEQLDWIHRRLGSTDFYFVRNTTADDVKLKVTFRAPGRIPQWWDPVSGHRGMPLAYRGKSDGTEVLLDFPPYGAGFVIFPQQARAEIREEWAGLEPPKLHAKETLDLSRDWTVSFPAGMGAPTRTNFDRLMSWTESDHPGLRHFSGTATYRKTFELSRTADPASGERVVLDLGEVGYLARVYLNGHALGVSWFPPHVLDVTAEVRPGVNHLVVEVASTWLNRLVGDAKNPDERPYTFSNLAARDAEGPGDRPWRNKDLQPSGLMGPVQVRLVSP